MTNNLHTSECNENKFLFFKINLHHYFLPFSTNHNKKNNSLKTISYMKQHKEYTKNKQIKWTYHYLQEQQSGLFLTKNLNAQKATFQQIFLSYNESLSIIAK